MLQIRCIFSFQFIFSTGCRRLICQASIAQYTNASITHLKCAAVVFHHVTPSQRKSQIKHFIGFHYGLPCAASNAHSGAMHDQHWRSSIIECLQFRVIISTGTSVLAIPPLPPSFTGHLHATPERQPTCSTCVPIRPFPKPTLYPECTAFVRTRFCPCPWWLRRVGWSSVVYLAYCELLSVPRLAFSTPKWEFNCQHVRNERLPNAGTGLAYTTKPLTAELL